MAAVAATLLAGVWYLPGPSGDAPRRVSRPVAALGSGASAEGLVVDGASPELQPVTAAALAHDTSPPLRSMDQLRPLSARRFEEPDASSEQVVREVEQLPNRDLSRPTFNADPAIQSAAALGVTPDPLLSFPGLSNGDNAVATGSTYWPPDTNGAAGAGYYVQTVNVTMAVYNVAGGRLWGPGGINTIWSGFGGTCETHADGDPMVMFDELASRWLVSEFALDHETANYRECIAVSATDDPTGRWYRYDFRHPKGFTFGDYPKFGVWPDGYYMSVNQFTPNLAWAGAGAIVYEREKMLNGQGGARLVYFDLAGQPLAGMLPSDLEGAPPPSGTPNLFAQIDDDAWGYVRDQLELWEFHVDWSQTAASTFRRVAAVATAPFSSTVCGTANCIVQPETTRRLDQLSDRLMQPLRYRSFGSHVSLVTSHTVAVDGVGAGVRWYELRNTSGTWEMQQQGTYAPDGDGRWMSSAAMDALGDLAIGYSVSGASTFPSIRYAGRTPTDPPGILGAETTMADGHGSQSGVSRWGDYSALSVDPRDGCTFWYTQELYERTSATGWETRIGAFRFPACASGTPPSAATISGPTVTKTFQTALRVPIGWTSDGGQPPLLYDVRYRRAPWSDDLFSATSWLYGTPDPGATFRAKPGGTYCLSARAVDQVPNVGDWGQEVCTAFPMNETSLRERGTWIWGEAGGYYLGDYTSSTDRGSSLSSPSISGTRLAVVVTTCPGCGKLKALWNGVRLTTLDLASPTTQKRVVIEVARFESTQTGTLVLKVATDGLPVYVEGVGVSAA